MALVVVLGDLLPQSVRVLVDMQHVDGYVGPSGTGAEREGNRGSRGSIFIACESSLLHLRRVAKARRFNS